MALLRHIPKSEICNPQLNGCVSVSVDRPIKDFLAEAEDILETANQALLSLEHALGAGSSDPDALNSLFRAVHSFKGLAGMYGLKAPSDITHKLEFLLDELRLGKVVLGRQALDVVLETLSLIGRLVQQVAARQPNEDIAPVAERIDAVLKAKPSAAEGRSLLEQIELDRGILQVLTEYEE